MITARILRGREIEFRKILSSGTCPAISSTVKKLRVLSKLYIRDLTLALKRLFVTVRVLFIAAIEIENFVFDKLRSVVNLSVINLVLEHVSSKTRHVLTCPIKLYTCIFAVTKRSLDGMFVMRLMVSKLSDATRGIDGQA